MIYPIFNEVIGKKTHANPMSQPKGSCRIVKNWETVRDNTYRKPRGRDTYSNDTTLPNSTVDMPMKYQDVLYLHYANNTIYYDDTGTPGDFIQATDIAAGTAFTPPAGYSMGWLENNNNLYITTDDGILKLDAYAGDFYAAGIPKGLGCDIRVTFPVAGTWLPINEYVAYRHVWSYTDANNKKNVGAPSERQEIQNGAVGVAAVELRIYIPDGITTDHLLELYRTTNGAVSQPENEQLVYQINPTAADIVNGYMLIDDITPTDFRDAYLYTNTTREGINQSNDVPPLARSIDKYKTFNFYANINNLHRLYTALISVTNLTAGVSSLTITDGVSPFTMGCYAPVTGGAVTGTANAAGLIRVSVGAGHGLTTGDYCRITDVTGTVEANGVWEVTVINPNDIDLVGSAYANAWTGGGNVDRYEDIGATPRFILYTALATTALNIDATARSIVRCLNQTTANTYLYGYIVSNVDDPPGKMMFTNRTLRDVAFSVTVNSDATGSNFSPIIPTAGTTYISTNDRLVNAYMWSKSNEQEAVPLVNIGYVGSSNDRILRVIGLRDSVFFIKETEGVYQLTGDAPPWNVDEFDGTVRCLQADSIDKGQNAIFMMSNLGYVKISNSGVEVIGRDNEYQDLKPILNVDYETNGFGWFYEDEKSYKHATMLDENSAAKDIVKVYNTFNQSWRDSEHGIYTNDGNIGCGIIVGSREYTFGVVGRTVYQERKSFTANDHCTPDITNNITAIDAITNTVTLNTAITIPAESILSQIVGPNIYNKIIIEVVDTTHYVLNNVNNLAIAACTIIPGIVSELEYNPIHCGSPFVEKFIKQIILQFDGEETSIENINIDVRTDKSPTPLEIAMTELPTNYWGLVWGEIWGAFNQNDKFLTWSTKEHSQATIIYVKVRHLSSRRQVALSGLGIDFESISEGRNKDR